MENSICKKRDSRQVAAAAWGDDMPDWVELLAVKVNEIGSQAKSARVLGYSAATINQVLQNKYKGNLGKVRRQVEAVFMATTVECPVLGTMAVSRCMENRNREFCASSGMRVRLWKACRTCIHNL
jgi:hypothetical protein